MRSRSRNFSLSLVALALAACEPPPVNCTLEAVAGLNVTVVDAAGDAVCDAEVTARDGEFEEVLEAAPGGCAYFGAFERAGTYQITARVPGQIGVVNDVLVEADECHVIPESVEVALEAVGCTEETVPGLEISVFDAQGARVCGAFVAAEDGDHEELLEPVGAAGDCRYLGAFEREGSYTITATAAGFLPVSLAEPVVVEQDFDGCHVETEARELSFTTPVEACTASIEDGLRVTVEMEGACTATVTAIDGQFSEVLAATGSPCVFQGVEERPGRYEVRVEAAGFETAFAPAVILTDGCHPILEELTVALTAE